MHPISNPSQGKVEEIGEAATEFVTPGICETAMRATLILSLICLLAFAARAQAPSLEFTDYPARIIQATSSGRVRGAPRYLLFSHDVAPDRKAGRQGSPVITPSIIGVAGLLCARIGIVDLITGRAYVSPFYVGIAGGGQHKSIKTETGSRLVLVNDPKVVREEYGEPAPEEFVPSYFLWTGKHLLPIREGKVDAAEPKRAFEPCTVASR